MPRRELVSGHQARLWLALVADSLVLFSGAELPHPDDTTAEAWSKRAELAMTFAACCKAAVAREAFERRRRLLEQRRLRPVLVGLPS
jgi:hypothetical protein